MAGFTARVRQLEDGLQPASPLVRGRYVAGARHMPPKDIPAEVLAPTVLEVDIRPVKSTGGSIE